MNTTNILLRRNYIPVPPPSGSSTVGNIATVIMNLSYYGYALSVDAYKSIVQLSTEDLVSWWSPIETELKKITGEDRKMADFVVYKNFPSEVLDKTESEYWLPQILMYWGFPNEMFTEEVKPREKMNEQRRAIVLTRAKNDTLKNILESLLQSPARWKEEELQDVLFLSTDLTVNPAKMAFKENLVSLATFLIANGKKINIKTGTDVLRLAAGLSDGDVSLREKVKFKSFSKKVRRFLLDTLENCTNLTEDMARRPELFKRFLHQLHPGDYKKAYPNVLKAYEELYHDRLVTFNSLIETGLLRKDPKVLDLLASRPGDFRRRLIHSIDLFGDKAVKAFVDDKVISKLSTAQIVSLRVFLETINTRAFRAFPPKGNWNRLQIGEPRRINPDHIKPLSEALGRALKDRLPAIKFLHPETSKIKLPNNGEVSPYARGTSFPIPEDVKFIRSASYWAMKTHGSNWFDNGWNFFDENWKSLGVCCWNEPQCFNKAAAFSGDPTNSKTDDGKACQMIDLYIDKLLKQGVRYAVWNILCFSNIPFSEAKEVYAALQWGNDATKGKLFEPSRAQLSFPLTGEQKTKYICLVDLQKREMIYLDANLKGDVSSARNNCTILETNMPVFMEYIEALPSVYDLFFESVDEKSSGAHILYSDKEAELKDVSAYVFRPENKNNQYNPVDINSLLL